MNRIHTLDGLRGIAALVVVIYHLAQVRLLPNLFPHGYLAVDFFFILSGFVVARAYEPRLRTKMSIRQFLVARGARLMPLSVLGALIGLAVLLAKWTWYPHKVDQLWQIVASGVLNVLLLPTPFGGAASHGELFPGNGPLWSLFFEVVANVAWATLLVRLTTRATLGFAVLGGVGFAVAAANLGHANFGWNVETAWFGLLRVAVGFAIGSVIHRILPAGRRIGGKLTTGALALALVSTLALPVSSSGYDIACILVVFPALVTVSARAVITQPAGQHVCAALGDLSYPLYVLHFPILLVASAVAHVFGGDVSPVLFAGAALLTSIVSAWFAFSWYDEPVRAKLGALLRGETRRFARAPVVGTALRSDSFSISPPPEAHGAPVVSLVGRQRDIDCDSSERSSTLPGS